MKDSRIQVCFCFATRRRLVSYIEYPRKRSVKRSKDSEHHCRERSGETLADLDGDKERSPVSRSSQETVTRRMCQLRITDDDQNVSTDRRPWTRRFRSDCTVDMSVRREPTWRQRWHRRNGYNHGGRSTRSLRNFRSPGEEVVRAVSSLCSTRRRKRPTFVNSNWVLRYIQQILQECRCRAKSDRKLFP